MRSALRGEGALVFTQIPAVLDPSPLPSNHTSMIQLGRIVYINHEIGVNVDIIGGSGGGQKMWGDLKTLSTSDSVILKIVFKLHFLNRCLLTIIMENSDQINTLYY